MKTEFRAQRDHEAGASLRGSSVAWAAGGGRGGGNAFVDTTCRVPSSVREQNSDRPSLPVQVSSESQFLDCFFHTGAHRNTQIFLHTEQTTMLLQTFAAQRTETFHRDQEFLAPFGRGRQ